MTKFEPKEENWFYCAMCDTVSYKFDCCGNTICNGGGCDKCSGPIGSRTGNEPWDQVWRLVKTKQHPPIEEMPKSKLPPFTREVEAQETNPQD